VLFSQSGRETIMRLDKKFLARLLGIPEAEIRDVRGMTFQLTKAAEDGPETFKALLDERFKKKLNALTPVLVKEDELGMVVRAHIHIEHELHDAIYFGAPSLAHLKCIMDKLEFSEKVSFALVLGLNADLKPALNAAGNLRNKFAHRLDMKLGEEDVKNLVSKLTPSAKQKFHVLLKNALTVAAGQPKPSAEAMCYFRTRTQLMSFFLQLFHEVAKERHRLAFERLQSMAWH
jgi:hypothetical protein